MLFAELYTITVNKVNFLGFTRAIASSASSPEEQWFSTNVDHPVFTFPCAQGTTHPNATQQFP